jgi:hypothetical protein
VIFARDALGRKSAPAWDEVEVPAAKMPRQRRLLHVKPSLITIVGMAVLLVLIAEVLAILSTPAGDWDYAHRFPPSSPNASSEFAAVAGEYYQGARRGRSWALCILPDGRYSFRWSGCLGVYHRESGYVNRVGGDLILWPENPLKRAMARVFLPVKWGPRSYLVPTDKLQEFCEAICRGDEPRSESPGEFYLRGVDERVAGIPELPEPWASDLRNNVMCGYPLIIASASRSRWQEP